MQLPILTKNTMTSPLTKKEEPPQERRAIDNEPKTMASLYMMKKNMPSIRIQQVMKKNMAMDRLMKMNKEDSGSRLKVREGEVERKGPITIRKGLNITKKFLMSSMTSLILGLNTIMIQPETTPKELTTRQR